VVQTGRSTAFEAPGKSPVVVCSCTVCGRFYVFEFIYVLCVCVCLSVSASVSVCQCRIKLLRIDVVPGCVAFIHHEK